MKLHRAYHIRIGICVVLACLGLRGASDGRAEDLERIDKLRFLYGGQLSFSPDGYPVVPVGIMDRKREVTLSSREGLRVQPEGEGGPEVRAGTEWRVRVEGGRAAKVRWSVLLERLSGKKRAGTAAAIERWRGRGEKPRPVEVGSMFGVRGTVMDRRALLILAEPSPSEAAARARADEVAKRHGIDAQAFEEIIELPRGSLIATSGSVEVRNEGILWFAPSAEQGRITVVKVEFGGVGDKAHTGREDRSYLGRIYVALDKHGTLAIVNAVPSNQLLAGLVPAEMFSKAPVESLRAQAVAARTELLSKIGTRHLTDPYRICSTQHCQVYAGAGKEAARATEAVRTTRGEVLFRADEDDLADAYYSASAGGFTENNDSIWGENGPDPILRGHLDAPADVAAGASRFTAGLRTDELLRAFFTDGPQTWAGKSSYNRDRYRWTVKRSAAELDRILAPLGVGAVQELVLGERGISGRLRQITVRGTRGERVVRGDLKIRQTLGNLKSAMFVLDVRREGSRPVEWTFSGAGFGHGVGMCQTGAIGMGEGGKDYRAILGHYYRGSRVVALY